MVKLRAFTEQADVEGRELRNLEPERSSSSRMDLDTQCGVRRREPKDVSPHCKSRRASSPSPATLSATTPDCVVASNRSTIAEIGRQGLNSGYASVDVGRNAGVSRLRHLQWPLSLCILIWILYCPGTWR